MTLQTEQLFSEEKVIDIWKFNGKNKPIISKVSTL